MSGRGVVAVVVAPLLTIGGGVITTGLFRFVVGLRLSLSSSPLGVVLMTSFSVCGTSCDKRLDLRSGLLDVTTGSFVVIVRFVARDESDAGVDALLPDDDDADADAGDCSFQDHNPSSFNRA